jgi:hypothetical protein
MTNYWGNLGVVAFMASVNDAGQFWEHYRDMNADSAPKGFEVSQDLSRSETWVVLWRNVAGDVFVVNYAGNINMAASFMLVAGDPFTTGDRIWGKPSDPALFQDFSFRRPSDRQWIAMGMDCFANNSTMFSHYNTTCTDGAHVPSFYMWDDRRP